MDYGVYNNLINDFREEVPNINLVKYLTPINLKEEKIKFFDSKYAENPQFEYKKITLPSFPKLELLNDPIGKLLDKKFTQAIDKYRLIQTKDAASFSKLSKKIFGGIDKKITESAYKIVERYNKKVYKNDTTALPFEYIQSEIQSVLSDLKLDIKLKVIDEPNFSNKISASKDSLVISKQYVADNDELIDLINHEINTHIFRNYNGKTHPFLLFNYNSADYLETEEGLATIMGHAFKQNKLMIHPALLYIAIDNSLTNDFVATYKTMLELCGDNNQAWTYTLRAKRGIGDTSQKGAYTKDAYLRYASSTAQKLISNPKLLETAFDGNGSLEELFKYKHDYITTHDLQIENVQSVYASNFS